VCVVITNYDRYFNAQQRLIDDLQATLDDQQSRVETLRTTLTNASETTPQAQDQIRSVIRSVLDDVEQNTAQVQGLTSTSLLQTLQDAET
jgi:uncharacterized coiled-coil protein SlyX